MMLVDMVFIFRVNFWKNRTFLKCVWDLAIKLSGPRVSFMERFLTSSLLLQL